MNIQEFKESMDSFNEIVDEFTETVGDVFPDCFGDKLLELKRKAQFESFKVLVMSSFGSGKLPMLDVLLGEPLLQKYIVLDTAIITEIRYGSKRATIYPKKGQWQGSDEPFDVPIDKLRDYLRMMHIEGDIIESPFEKMVISWPLDVLKDGVEIVVFPSCCVHMSSAYLSKAHAVIYVMSGLNPYNASDVSELEELRLRNFTTPIFVVTGYDNVEEDAYENQDDPKEYLREYKEKVNSDLKRHTDLTKKEYQDMLGADGIFYVSSREAKRAKKTIPWDNELYIRSGYADFEKYLADYLVKCKGLEIIRSSYYYFNRLSVECVRMLSEQLNAADISLAECETEVASM